MAVRRYWVHSADAPEFNTSDGRLHAGEWSWFDQPTNSKKYVYGGLDTYDQPYARLIDDTDPEWLTNDRPQDRVRYVGLRWKEIIVRVNFGPLPTDDLLRGQYSISGVDPDLRWVRYFTNNGRHTRAMRPESLSKHGPPQANLTQIPSPVDERFVERNISEDYYKSADAPGKTIRPADCGVDD